MGFLKETVRFRCAPGRLAVLVLLSSLSLHAQLPGAPIFASNCSGCHGADGRGGEHAPNIATAPEVSRMLDRELAGIIHNGIAGAGMPAFPSFKQQEVTDVIAYLRFLQGRGEVAKLPGDPHRGEALFFGSAGCSECHMINGKGGFMGSELSYYGANAQVDMLRAILLDPDKNLPVQKKAVTVVTRAGQTTTGMLRLNDNFSLTLQTPDGSFHSFPKADLTRVDFGSRSLMPPARLDSKQMDDLVSYLLKAGNDNATRTPSHASNSNDDDN